MRINKFLQYIVLSLLWLALPSAIWAQSRVDTLQLYFDTGKSEFNNQTRHLLDSLFYNDQVMAKQSISVIGYTDYVGSEAYNDKLSRSRAQYVANYFVSMGIEPKQIKQTIGKGEISRLVEKQGGYKTDRRVDVVLELQAGKQTGKMLPAPKQVVPNSFPKRIEMAVGQTFVLDKIYFYAGRHIVKPESLSELENLYEALAANDKIIIQIEGHVCCVRNAPDALDDDTHELALSTNRAKYIYDYLIDKGIDADRLRYRGFGRSRPIVMQEHSAEDEDKNRRVEIRILKH